jgi:dephospho-CoA kinase
VVIVDATLIFDWQLERELDLTIVIYAPRKIRFARLAKKGVNESDARARQRRQLSLAEYRKRADVMIDNRGTETDLKRRLDRLWSKRIAKAIDS